MCLSIPYQVVHVNKNFVTIETGAKIKITKEMKVKKGAFVRIVGNIVVDSLTKSQGLKIRTLIKTLN